MAKKEQDNAHKLLEKFSDGLAKAEDNFQKNIKDLTARFVDAQADARRRLDELVELVQDSAELRTKLPQDALARLAELRDNVESRVEDSTDALLARLGLATKTHLDETNRKLAALARRVKELEGARKPSSSRRAEA